MTDPTEPQVETTKPSTEFDVVSQLLLRAVLALIIVLLGTAATLLYYLGNQNTAPKTYTERELAQWEAAVAENPGDASAWAKLAYSYAEAGRIDEALTSVDRGRRVAQADALVLVEADVLRIAGRYAEALDAYDVAEQEIAAAQEAAELELQKKNVFLPLDGASMGGVYYGRGLCRIELKDIEGAIADLEKAVDVMPQQSTIRIVLAEQYAKTGEYDRAEEQYSEALRYVPDDPAALEGLETVKELTGR